MDYIFGTEPFEHQRTGFEQSKDKRDFAYLMEMGTGKTKLAIDAFCYQWAKGWINFVMIVAPNGVHRNWIIDELPKHMPDWVPYRACFWQSNMKKAQKEQFEHVMYDREFTGLRIVAFNVEAFGIPERYWKPKLRAVIASIVKAYRVFAIVDESTTIKTPGAKRAQRLIKIGRHCESRRILTGMMITTSPMDAYMQYRFLGDGYLGFTNYYAFRAHYAELEDQYVGDGQGGRRKYKKIVDYKNLDQLMELVDRLSFRCRKKDCLDLPGQLFQRRYIDPSDEQKRIYNRLAAQFQIETDNEPINVPMVITRIMRLQQILGGFVPLDEDGGVKPIFKKPSDNPRIRALFDIADEAPRKIIVWARFRAEIESIAAALRDKYGHDSTVMYYGGVSNDEKEFAKQAFNQPDGPRWWVGQPQAGGRGLTLLEGTTMVFYSNDRSPEIRRNATERSHRIGQTESCLYLDFEVPGSVDTDIIDALQNHLHQSDYLLNKLKKYEFKAI